MAKCTDCQWTYEDHELEAVADALERHARKEQHHVELHRRTAASA